MENQQRPQTTPIMALKAFGLAISMFVGFGAAFYAGYNSMPYVLAPAIFLELSCSTTLVLIQRYLKGKLFQGNNSNSIKGSFWLGCVLLTLSVIGVLAFAITGFGHIKGFEYEKYGLWAALGPCILAVFWSSVLIYDARYFWRMWEREVGNNLARRQVHLYP